MTRMFLNTASTIGVLLSCATAQAADRPFGTIAAVEDRTLATVRGTYRLTLFTLTVGQMAMMQDAVARSDFRMTAGIGAVSMDNWWFDAASDPAGPLRPR